MKRIPCKFCHVPKGVMLTRGLGFVLLGLLAVGCPGGKRSPETAVGGKVIIKGSNTIGEELAPRLVAEYQKEHPAATFEIEPKATMYGLAALRVGQCDIAAASREVLKEELELARGLGLELKEYIIGAYSVAVVVNSGSPVGNLTREQVRDIFTGAIQNWKEVGGPDAPIHLYIRDPVSGTHLGFKELAMENKPYAAGPKLLTSYAAIVQAVAQDAHGIGYSGLDTAKSAGVKAVAIGGVAPVAASVNQGKYPYARVLRLYTIKGKETPAAGEFIKYVLSPQGQTILAGMGFAPHP